MARPFAELNFRTPVAGVKAARLLMEGKVTQTIKSRAPLHNSGIPVQLGETVKVLLDGAGIGLVKMDTIQPVRFPELTIKDAEKCGFENLQQLERQLRRAGYRDKPISYYRLCRIAFSWTTRLTQVS